jgi:hypothetical protein
VVAVRVDEFGIDRAPAPIAEDPRHFPPQGAARHLLELLHELGEVGVGPFVVGLGPDFDGSASLLEDRDALTSTVR